MYNSLRLASFALLFGAMLCCTGVRNGWTNEPDVELSWRIVAADCNHLLREHRREAADTEQGEDIETLVLRGGNGTYVYAQRTVMPARVIEDLDVSVWIEADRPGLQVLARIVIPDSIDPQTGRRASILIDGELYEREGRWQRVHVRNLPAKMQRQVRVLRARLQQPVSTRNAYLDAVLVNVYGGPGTTHVRLGSIEQNGHIPPAKLVDQSHVMPAGYDQPTREAPAPPRTRSDRLIVNDRPFFPRLIEYRGEPLTLLKELGFNTVYLTQQPTKAQVAQARELDLWFVAPPPAEQVVPNELDDRILGWHLSDQAIATALTNGRTDALRRRDPHRRPMIAEVRRGQWRASREFDILLRDRQPLGSSFPLSHFGPWLDQMSQLARPGTPFWCGVQT